MTYIVGMRGATEAFGNDASLLAKRLIKMPLGISPQSGPAINGHWFFLKHHVKVLMAKTPLDPLSLPTFPLLGVNHAGDGEEYSPLLPLPAAPRSGNSLLITAVVISDFNWQHGELNSSPLSTAGFVRQALSLLKLWCCHAVINFKLISPPMYTYPPPPSLKVAAKNINSRIPHCKI